MEKKLILIGSGAYFTDSFIYFAKKGFKVKVIKTGKTTKWFMSNYQIYQDLNFEIIDADYENKDFIKSLDINKNTIVIGGGGYFGDLENYPEGRKSAHNDLWVLKEIANYNKQNNLGALTVRYFNGDTGFGTKMEAELFEESLKNVDLLIFDNDNLRDFVIYNAPSLKNKKYIYAWFETPLKQFVYHNENKEYKKQFISFGRNICSTEINYPSKAMFYPYPYNKFKGIKRITERFYHKKIQHLKSIYYIAGMSNYKQILSDRKEVFEKLSKITFGLSHFYDIFQNSVEEFLKNKEFYFSLTAQNSSNKEGGG